tara:strand:+ start:2366 stop:2557 length:192 start_codon:yes stop_codon:yes gene_type:complete
MSEENSKPIDDEDLDDLLSMRGKPFVDWKEERKYLREKWGMQGRKIQVEPPKTDQKENEEHKL